MERSNGSMVRDPDCALVRQAIEKPIQEIKSWESYKSLFPRTGITRLLQDMAKMHCAGRAGQGSLDNISVLLAPHSLEH